MIQPLQFFTPDDLPPEILVYEKKLRTLDVGMAGKVGALHVELEKDSFNDKTIIKTQYSKVPLYLGRALYYEEALPSMAYLYIVSPSGGILQGDRYRMDIILRNNAIAHITTQGATRIYNMNANFATQLINVTVDNGCYLEFIPDQIIPYRNSRFYQKLNLKVHDNATMIYSEMIVPGRVAMNESFEYDICYLRAVGKNQNDKLRFIDTALLEPKKQSLEKICILGTKKVVGSIYILTPKEHVDYLNEEINTNSENNPVFSAKSSILPNYNGLLVRILGELAEEVKLDIYEVVKLIRKKILNAPFSGIRKN